MEFKAYTSAELDSATFEQKAAEYEKRMQIPLGLIEKIQRPWAGVSASDMDEVDEEDLCKAFARDIGAILQISSLVPGIPLTDENLGKLHSRPAVYWLVAPPDAKHKHWHMVFVNYTEDLHESWNIRRRSLYQRAVAANCVLDWWDVQEEILQELITSALKYHFKPKWNLEI